MIGLFCLEREAIESYPSIKVKLRNCSFTCANSAPDTIFLIENLVFIFEAAKERARLKPPIVHRFLTVQETSNSHTISDRSQQDKKTTTYPQRWADCTRGRCAWWDWCPRRTAPDHDIPCNRSTTDYRTTHPPSIPILPYPSPIYRTPSMTTVIPPFPSYRTPHNLPYPPSYRTSNRSCPSCHSCTSAAWCARSSRARRPPDNERELLIIFKKNFNTDFQKLSK